MVRRKIDAVSAYLQVAIPYEERAKVIVVRIPKELYDMEGDNVGSMPMYAIVSKALYGHPESGKLFNDLLNQVILREASIQRSICDPSVYYARYPGDHMLLVTTHVDDLGTNATGPELIDEFLDLLRTRIEVEDEGANNSYLSITLLEDSNSITCVQDKYITKLNEKFPMMSGGARKHTPLSPHELLTLPDKAINIKRLQEMNGYIGYIVDNTRYECTYARSLATADLSGHVAESLLKYLMSTPDIGPRYRNVAGVPIVLNAYMDASFAQAPYGYSYFGYAIFPDERSAAVDVGGGRITSVTPISSADAELYALVECVKAMVHLRNQCAEYGEEQIGPSIIYCDNSAVVALSSTVKVSKKSRHMLYRMHYVRQAIRDGVVAVRHVKGTDNVADLLTKPLPRREFERYRDRLLGYDTAVSDSVVASVTDITNELDLEWIDEYDWY
jgi:hypothetical protein